MSRIVIDNWSLERAAVAINDTYEKLEEPNNEYANLIEAIILWDEVSYFDNSFTSAWKRILDRFEYNKFLTPLEDFSVDLDENYLTLEGYAGIVERGALEYVKKCAIAGTAYTLTNERMEYLSKLNLNKRYRERIPLDILNTKLNNYYKIKDRCSELPPFPALFDYVRNETKDDRFYIQTALQIRKSKEAIRFRDWLDELNDSYIAGNHQKVGKMLDKYESIIDSTLKVISGDKGYKAEVSIIPGIVISDIRVPNLMFSMNPCLGFVKKVVKKSMVNRPINYGFVI